MKRSLVLLSLFLLTQSVKLPSSFIKCNRKDLEWKKCVFKAAVDAVSQFTKPFDELNVPNLEPMYIPELTIDAGAKTIQLTQYFKNIHLYGLTNIVAKRFEFDFDKKIIIVEGSFPEIKLPGEYKFDGKVLLLPIIGEGTGEQILKNLDVNLTMKFEEVKKKGKTYIKIISGDLKMVPGHITFKFDNLFNGDKTLGDNINQVLNDNWEAVYEDIEDGYTELVKKIFINLANGFFSKVSIEEAFD